MTLPARAWLPANALADNTVQTQVAECVAAWARRWLPDPRDCTAATHTVAARTKIPAAFMCWANEGPTVTLAIDETSASKLASQMIGAPAGGRLSGADLKLYRQLAEKCCVDLLSELAALFESDRSVRDARQAEVNVETKYSLSFAAGGPSFDVYVDKDLILRARRSAARSARPGAPMGRLREAIGRQQINVGAAIGAATIALGDLYGLVCGDVVVLDEAFGDGVLLTINNRAAPTATALVQRTEMGLELHVAEMGQA